MLKRRLGVASLPLISLAAAFPDYPVKPAREYPTLVQNSGLLVAAIPVESRQEQHKYFGIDLSSKGYLPVLVVIDNGSSISYLVDKTKLMYVPAGASGHWLPNAAKTPASETAIEVVSVATPVFGFVAHPVLSKLKGLRQHLLAIELQSATISPGQSVHGFIFIPVRGRDSSRPKVKVIVPATQSGTDRAVTLETTI
jgi:hypothetical protein